MWSCAVNSCGLIGDCFVAGLVAEGDGDALLKKCRADTLSPVAVSTATEPALLHQHPGDL